MNILKKVAAALVVSLGMIGAAGASSLQEIAESSYMLYGGNSPHCSIVAVSPTQFVTANHCVEGETDLNVRTIEKNDKFQKVSEEVRYLKVLRTIKAKDVAFLELIGPSQPNHVWVDVAKPDTKIEFGDELIHVGYPGVLDLTVTDGLYTNLVESPFADEDAVLKTTVPVTGGSSGGGFYRAKGSYETSPMNGNKVGFGVNHPAVEYELIGTTIGMNTRTSFQTYISTPQALDAVMKGLLNTAPVPAGEKTNELPAEDPVKDGVLINPSDEK